MEVIASLLVSSQSSDSEVPLLPHQVRRMRGCGDHMTTNLYYINFRKIQGILQSFLDRCEDIIDSNSIYGLQVLILINDSFIHSFIH